MSPLTTGHVFLLSVALAVSTEAAEINGKISEASGDTATIVLEGELAPSVGDKAEIFFKHEGVEISVATGNVAEISATSAKVKITEASGTVSKDQSARITSDQPSKKPAATSTSTTAGTPAPFKASGPIPSIQGDWTGAAPDKSVISFSFKDDNSVLWVVTDTVSGVTLFALGKYRVDTTKTPNILEVFDIEEGDLKGETLRGIFEFQSDGRLKYDASVGYNEHPEQGFTSGTMFLSRAASPIVIPPGATLTMPKKDVAATSSSSPTSASSEAPPSPVDPTPDPSKPPDEQKIDIGDVYYNRRDWEGAYKAYSEAIRINPKNSWGYRNRGSVLYQQDLYENAIADYEQAIKLDPKRWKESLGKSIKDLREMAQRQKEQPK